MAGISGVVFKSYSIGTSLDSFTMHRCSCFTVIVVVLVSALTDQRVDAWTCQPEHPQTAFCRADFGEYKERRLEKFRTKLIK